MELVSLLNFEEAEQSDGILGSNLPTIGAHSSASSTREIVTFGGVSTATFLLGFFDPSAFLLRFLLGSDILS